MKFCKMYQEYMQKEEQKELPSVGFKSLKKILKSCRDDDELHTKDDDNPVTPSVAEVGTSSISVCPAQCQVCDGTFFSSLLKEMSEILECFNKRAQPLVEIHLAKGLRRYYLRWKWKQHKDHATLIQEGQNLVTYAMINATAVRKILKKYDKIHCCKQGQQFKSSMRSLNVDILRSPLVCELMALQINLEEKKSTKSVVSFEGCYPACSDCKPSLSCQLFDFMKLEIDLTCSICLETVFDAAALTCGHIFCYMCACSAASVSIVDGLDAADSHQRCPLCRVCGVYEGAVHPLTELNILLSRKCPEYWQQRLQSERQERLQLAKKHYESIYKAFAI